MGTIIASQTVIAGARYPTAANFATSQAFPFSVYDDITATILNATSATTPTQPTQPPQVTLYLSPDNVNYTAVDRRIGSMVPGQCSYHVFPLSNYAGWSPGMGPWDFLSGGQQFTGAPSGLAANSVNSIQSCKLLFSNPGPLYNPNVAGSSTITVAATDGCTQNLGVIPIVGVAATTGGAVAAWQPPGGGRILIIRAILDIITGAGSATLSIGVAANATTSSTNLFTVAPSAASALTVDNIGDATAVPPIVAACRPCAAGSWVTVTGSLTTAGVAGNLYIQYIKP